MKFLFKSLLLSMSMMMVFTSCSDDDDNTTDPGPSGPGSLTATLAADARFSILVDALQRTGLDATLDAEGEYTVFAPTDAAFSDLLNELQLSDLNALENELSTAGLRNVLLYHVLGAEVPSSAVAAGYVSSLGTNSEGDNLSMYITTDGGVRLNNRADVEETDIAASNGVAHVIDAVILPMNTVQLLSVNADYSSLVAALSLADGDLDGTLAGSSASFTIFAPNNAAFDTLVANTQGVNDLAGLVAAIGTDVLAQVLLYHVTENVVLAADLSTGPVRTLASDGAGGNINFFVNVGSSSVTIIDNNVDTDDATVIQTDLIGTNGAVHFLDAVLLPE